MRTCLLFVCIVVVAELPSLGKSRMGERERQAAVSTALFSCSSHPVLPVPRHPLDLWPLAFGQDSSTQPSLLSPPPPPPPPPPHPPPASPSTYPCLHLSWQLSCTHTYTHTLSLSLSLSLVLSLSSLSAPLSLSLCLSVSLRLSVCLSVCLSLLPSLFLPHPPSLSLSP